MIINFRKKVKNNIEIYRTKLRLFLENVFCFHCSYYLENFKMPMDIPHSEPRKTFVGWHFTTVSLFLCSLAGQQGLQHS